MKILLLLLLPALTFAQAKKSNTIEIKNVSLSEGVRQLMAQGYMIEKVDTAYGYAYSKYKSIKNNLMMISLTRTDSALLVRGTADMNLEFTIGGVASKTDPFPIEFKGQKNSPMRKCWDELDRFAKSFNRDVQYSTQ
jgi:hypothetical protein